MMKTNNSLLSIELDFVKESFSKEYQVEIETVLNGYADEAILHLFHLKVHCEPMSGKRWQLTVEKRNSRLKPIENNSAVEEMIKHSAEALEKIICVIDQKGKIASIQNAQQIRNKFQQIRKEVQSLYTDENTMCLLNVIENKLKSDDTLLRTIESDFFLQMYLLGFFVETNVWDLHESTKTLFNIGGLSAVICQIKQKQKNKEITCEIKTQIENAGKEIAGLNNNAQATETNKLNGELIHQVNMQGIIENIEGQLQIQKNETNITEFIFRCKTA
jgi:hypothetical protein